MRTGWCQGQPQYRGQSNPNKITALCALSSSKIGHVQTEDDVSGLFLGFQLKKKNKHPNSFLCER